MPQTGIQVLHSACEGAQDAFSRAAEAQVPDLGCSGHHQGVLGCILRTAAAPSAHFAEDTRQRQLTRSLVSSLTVQVRLC